MNGKVTAMHILYSRHDSMTERPTVDLEMEPLTKCMTSFAYLMLGPEKIGRRQLACFCHSCLCANSRSRLVRDNQILNVPSCTCRLAECYEEQQIRPIPTGIAGRRAEAQMYGHLLASRLRPGTFIAVQNRESWSQGSDMLYANDSYWIAKIRATDPVERIGLRTTIAGIRFDKADYCIHLECYFQ